MRVSNLYYYKSEALVDARKRAQETGQVIEKGSANIDYFDKMGERAEKELDVCCGETMAFLVGADTYAYWEND